jgi:uncharacterized lipoprotein YmbA
MRPFSRILMWAVLLLAACATQEMKSQTGWLANAPEYAQNSGSGNGLSEEPSDAAHTHGGHSGHR